MSEFSLISWNIMQGRLFGSIQAAVRAHLRKLNPDIVCLQESPGRIRRFLHPRRKRHLVIPAHFTMVGEEPHNQNIIASTYAVSGHGEIGVPHHANRLKNLLGQRDASFSTWADINCSGTVARIYNCHLKVVGAGIGDRLRAIQSVFVHSLAFQGPVCICGDMNTTLPKPKMIRALIRLWHRHPEHASMVDGKEWEEDEKFIFYQLARKYGFREALDLNTPTWGLPYSGFVESFFNLKLDWMLVRGIKEIHAQLGPYISDHRPVFARCTI